MEYKSLPLGIDDFAKLRENNFYYVDKTGMIIELLRGWGEVNLFTRPRRFGKTLNMSMLKHFFEIGTDKRLFEGLAISREKQLCDEHLGKYPVISLSLKSVNGFTFQDGKERLWALIKREATRFDYLQDSQVLSSRDKQIMMNYSLGQGDLIEAVLEMSRILYLHHGQKVILLIDEYDVPLQKAEQEGFYREMVKLISQIFDCSMKSNPYIKFAVVTGCLRVSKESIFTGFNNPKMHTIADKEYDEWFGFTGAEVGQMLKDYGQSKYEELTKKWYDGYLFGEEHVYCPWDVVNWVNQLVRNRDDIPRNFWANTSGNYMIRRFAELAQGKTKEQLEQLLEGKCIWKKINLELTYDELEDQAENLWSVLFMTGYLTYRSRNAAGEYELLIPNQEIHNLFREMIDKWFKDRVLGDKDKINSFYKSLDEANAEKLEQCIRSYLIASISYFDGGKGQDKEAFYHGMMMGMLQLRDGWIARSNREAGEGRLDIVTYSEWGDQAIIFEFKYVKDYDELESAACAALQQIEVKEYDKYFDVEFAKEITHIGIAFCRKRCRVMVEKQILG